MSTNRSFVAIFYYRTTKPAYRTAHNGMFHSFAGNGKGKFYDFTENFRDSIAIRRKNQESLSLGGPDSR
jgi:hypothetical protein